MHWGRALPGLVGLLLFLATCLTVAPVNAQATSLPTPLGVFDVVEYAGKHRREIVAARALARAAAQRGVVVSDWEDPMIMPSVDHLPFMLHGVDVSFMVEQRFAPLGLLTERRRVADADARRLNAQVDLVQQDVQLDAARAFYMLRERRAIQAVLKAQLGLAREVVATVGARYATGMGTQADVFRAEVEVARLEGSEQALTASVAAAEAMLNASLGRTIDARIPALKDDTPHSEPSSWRTVRHTALSRRAELDVGRAEIARAEAETSMMQAMSRPMGFVRTGPAYTMSDGLGWMAMLGLTIPIWRDKYDAGVAEARAMTDMARADLSAMQLMVEGQAATARFEVVSARSRVVALRDNVLPRARQAMEPAVAAYAAGTAPLVSVLDAAQALWSLESELVFAEAELGMAWVALLRAQGHFMSGGKP